MKNKRLLQFLSLMGSVCASPICSRAIHTCEFCNRITNFDFNERNGSISASEIMLVRRTILDLIMSWNPRLHISTSCPLQLRCNASQFQQRDGVFSFYDVDDGTGHLNGNKILSWIIGNAEHNLDVMLYTFSHGPYSISDDLSSFIISLNKIKIHCPDTIHEIVSECASSALNSIVDELNDYLSEHRLN